MDIQEILTAKIAALEPGPHSDGLRAVNAHIDAAVRHLQRGQAQPDDSLFTDVIFRCNQAFEGSIKEAYRVLAERDPRRETPANIEQFLSSSELLSQKVLAQFSNYRREWRNPSTHDYTLDFDEDEALLAIVSVTVFAIVLCDQIASRLAYVAASTAAESHVPPEGDPEAPLDQTVSSRIIEFLADYKDEESSPSAAGYFRFEGALAGFLAANFANTPDVVVTHGARLGQAEADIVVERGAERVILELKKMSSRAALSRTIARAAAQASYFINEHKLTSALVVAFVNNEQDYQINDLRGSYGGPIKVIAPISSRDAD